MFGKKLLDEKITEPVRNAMLLAISALVTAIIALFVAVAR